MSKNRREEPVIFVKWMEFITWLLPVTSKFPKHHRFTLVDRIDNLALDITENLIEARYSSDATPILKQANLRLEKLRILLRLAKDLGHLPYKSFEFAMRSMNEVGKMLGGWRKHGECDEASR